MTREALLVLAARAEAAEGPDRELDAEIMVALKSETYLTARLYRIGELAAAGAGPDSDWRNAIILFQDVPYTASLDAAMTLVPDDLFPTIDFVTKRVWIRDAKGFDVAWGEAHGFAATVPLSICAAALRARAGDGV
jgi:hypothetical protein